MPNLDTLISAIATTQKTLFILCGFPYSGKSYVATQVRERTAIEYVSIDAIFHARGFSWDDNRLPTGEEWEAIFEESYRQTTDALEQGKNVLYDSTNQTVASRDTLRRVALDVGADAYVVYVRSSIDTVWNRWEENQKNPTRPIVSRELVQMTLDMFEEPTEAEHVIVVSN